MSQEFKPKYHLFNLYELEPASPLGGGGVGLITYSQKYLSMQCTSTALYQWPCVQTFISGV